ncbi:MAG: hypothetical protein M3Q98_12805 [Actinomycetota bacterium]|nr:hypothetical protein [Actinomycetota bacterium]
MADHDLPSEPSRLSRRGLLTGGALAAGGVAVGALVRLMTIWTDDIASCGVPTTTTLHPTAVSSATPG